MAAAVLRRRLDEAGLADRVAVESAGTGRWHIGEPADPRARAALRERGYSAGGHAARHFGATSFAEYDLVLALDRDILAELHSVAPNDAPRDAVQMLRAYDPRALAMGDLDVQDPYYGGADGFMRVLDQVEPAVDGLVDALRRELGDELRAD